MVYADKLANIKKTITSTAIFLAQAWLSTKSDIAKTLKSITAKITVLAAMPIFSKLSKNEKAPKTARDVLFAGNKLK